MTMVMFSVFIINMFIFFVAVNFMESKQNVAR